LTYSLVSFAIIFATFSNFLLKTPVIICWQYKNRALSTVLNNFKIIVSNGILIDYSKLLTELTALIVFFKNLCIFDTKDTFLCLSKMWQKALFIRYNCGEHKNIVGHFCSKTTLLN